MYGIQGYGFQGMIFTLQRWGVLDVLLPFILVFTIVFATLEQVKLFGKDKRNRKYSTMLALVMAFAVITPHVTGAYFFGVNPVLIINQALPQVGLLLVAIVMLLLTLGIWTGKKADGSKGAGVWFTLISGLIVIGIFVSSIGMWAVPRWLMWIIYSDVLALVIAVLVFGIIIRFIAADPEPPEQKKKKSFEKSFRAMLSGVDDEDDEDGK